MKALLNTIIVVAWVTMSLAVVSLVGHYRTTHTVSDATRGDKYCADQDMALQLLVFLIGVLSVVVMYALNRMLG